MDKLNADCLKQLRPFEAELVIKALRLKKKHEEILILKYVNEMSIDEIADLKHKAVQTIKNDLNKARKECNKYI